MKTRILILALTIFSIGTSAQTRYEQEMKNTLDALDKAQQLQDFKAVANKFDLISKVEKDKWLPDYYSSYVYTLMTYFDKDEDNRDKALDVAQTYLDKAKQLAADKEEVAILQAYIYQSRFFISPMARLKTFMQTNSTIEDLLKQYPENPRINMLQGIQLYHKPAFLGGGAEKAKPFFQKANVRYDKQQPKNALDPNWGKETNIFYLNKCS